MHKNNQKSASVLTLIFFLFSLATTAAEGDKWKTDLNNIRGLVKPVTSATLSSEIPGRIIGLPFKFGDAFRKGQRLVEFDCSLYNAELASAVAELEAQQKKHENNLQLLALNAISKIEVDISAINIKKADAERQMASIRVRRCIINAPYDGRVSDIGVHEYESVGPDQPLLSIISDKQLEIELIVPSNWLTWLKTGVRFQFVVDETKKVYEAKVIQLGASVDPVSQTIRVTGAFESDAIGVLSGMSGTAGFKDPEK